MTDFAPQCCIFKNDHIGNPLSQRSSCGKIHKMLFVRIGRLIDLRSFFLMQPFPLSAVAFDGCIVAEASHRMTSKPMNDVTGIKFQGNGQTFLNQDKISGNGQRWDVRTKIGSNRQNTRILSEIMNNAFGAAFTKRLKRKKEKPLRGCATVNECGQ